MRHRQFLLLSGGFLALILLSHSGVMAQQHPGIHSGARILKYPSQQAASKYYVTLIGEVGRPGVYEFDQPDLRLSQLIELAGGLNTETSSRNIFSFRNGRPGPQTFYTSDTPFVVMPGDILVAGRRPDYAAIRANKQGKNQQNQQHVETDLPQIVVLGLTDRPVFFALPMNAATIPGLFTLLNQDRNPARSIAVYPPHSNAFSYNASNHQPVPLSTGTIVMFEPHKVMRDGLPPFTPVVNGTSAAPQPNAAQVLREEPAAGPRIISAPLPESQALNSSAGPVESQNPIDQNQTAPNQTVSSPRFFSNSSQMASMNETVPEPQAASGSNTSTAKLEERSQQNTLPVNPLLREERDSVNPPTANQALELHPSPEKAPQFPEQADSNVAHAASIQPPLPPASETLPVPLTEVTDQAAEEEEEALPVTTSSAKVPKSTRKQAASITPLWLVMTLSGLGICCITALVVLVKDLNRFKAIVQETRESQSILEQILRGELPLQEETIDLSHGHHFTASPQEPLRRYRADTPHVSAEEKRWTPEPHANFKQTATGASSENYELEPAIEEPASGRRVDRHPSSPPSSHSRRSRSGSRTETPTKVSSSTVLDRILSAMNGERNARRS